MIFTFDIDIKPLACNIRRDWRWWKKEWDARSPNYHDGLQYLICVVIGFGGYCEIIRGLKRKKTAPYKNFVRPLSVIYHFKKFTGTVVFWTGWHQVHNCRNFKTNLLWEDQTLVHSCFLWLGKKKNSVFVKHSADLPEGQYWHKSQFRYNELQPISFGVR